MAKDVGLEVSHAPGPAYIPYLNRYDFIADTPAFRPSLIRDVMDMSDDVKFIYCMKDADSWVASMEKVKLSRNYNNMYTQSIDNPDSMNIHMQTDFYSLNEVLGGEFKVPEAQQAFELHRGVVQELIPADRLLMYDFNNGWKPLAEFMGVPIPDEEVPHLNETTMFDQLT
jgi:hypothetical protein